MSQVTVLAEGQITANDMLAVELVEANDTPAVVIIRWPAKALYCIRDCLRPLPMSQPASSLPPSCGWPRFDGTGSCGEATPSADPPLADNNPATNGW